MPVGLVFEELAMVPWLDSRGVECSASPQPSFGLTQPLSATLCPRMQLSRLGMAALSGLNEFENAPMVSVNPIQW